MRQRHVYGWEIRYGMYKMHENSTGRYSYSMPGSTSPHAVHCRTVYVAARRRATAGGARTAGATAGSTAGATAGSTAGATAALRRATAGWGQRESESERETGSAGAVTVLKRSLPSARDPALGKDFLKIKK
jgi:hypothetical protein